MERLAIWTCRDLPGLYDPPLPGARRCGSRSQNIEPSEQAFLAAAWSRSGGNLNRIATQADVTGWTNRIPELEDGYNITDHRPGRRFHTAPSTSTTVQG